MSKSSFKLDIKTVLKNIDTGNREWFSSLSDEEKEAFDPFIVMQFLSSGKDNAEAEYFLSITNEVLNKNFNVISKNKELFYRLACVCGTGKPTYHPFTRPPKAKRVSSLLEKLVGEYSGERMNKNEVQMLVNKNKLFGADYWVSLAESLDWSNDEIKKLEKELKKVL